MRWMYAICNRIKFLVITIVDLFRYICCLKRNRKETDFIPLSAVGVIPNDALLQINYDDDIRPITSANISSQSRNVEDYIKEYRQQKCKQMTCEPIEETSADYFQDMAPKIVQQQKIIVKQKDQSFNSSSMANSRLTFAPITASAITKATELASWEEMEHTGSWDVDERSTDQMLKEDRQLEREKRMMENSKKRMDKERARFGSKIS